MCRRHASHGGSHASFFIHRRCASFEKKHLRMQVLFFSGERWIRTIEVCDGRFTVCSLWPLGNLSIIWSWRWDSNPRPADYKSAALPIELLQQRWCLRVESNHRHKDFQSFALPTELPRQIYFGGPSGTRTPDRSVMSRLL